MRAFIGLGSNVGDGPAQLDLAISLLRQKPELDVLRVSSYYRTAPWGRTDQADFVNAVAELETDLSAESLLAELLECEISMGRSRDSGRWGPRPIDLDLLLCGSQVLKTSRLVLPHPRMHERAFVLVPLLELEPEVTIPGLGEASACLEKLPDQPVERLR